MKPTVLIAVVLAFVVVSVVTASTTTVHAKTLGDSPGEAFESHILAISGDGSIVVGQGVDIDAKEDEWHSFRGNTFSGFSSSPIIVDDPQKLEKMWEVEIPGNGFSTPVASANVIFLTTSYNSDRDLFLSLLMNWVTSISILVICVIYFVKAIYSQSYSLVRCFNLSLLLWILFE